MRRFSASYSVLLLQLCLFAFQLQAEVDMVWPSPGSTLWPGSTYFFRGQLKADADKLVINGTDVPLYHNGAFCADIPFDAAKPQLVCNWTERLKGDQSQIIQYKTPPKPDVNEPAAPEAAMFDNTPCSWEVTGALRHVKARWEPKGGYDVFLTPGTKYMGVATSPKEVMLTLAKNNHIHVDVDKVAKSAETNIAVATITKLSYEETPDALQYTLAPVPPLTFRWNMPLGQAQADFILYQCRAAIDRTSNLVSSHNQGCDWAQLQEDILRFRFYPTFQPLYGTSVRFKNNAMIITVKKPPWLTSKKTMVCIDPGHGGSDTGAIGPTRTNEKELNLLLARALSARLKQAGFDTVLTRNNDQFVPLDDRVAMTIENQADLFISLHYNATRGDPYKARGLETYYYYPSGLLLAKSLHPYLAAATSVADKGIRFGNYHVLRNEEVPSVLCEIDYMIIPEAEEHARQLTHLQATAEALLQGIIAFTSDLKQP
ncbi:MAG: N-acetylmuramoyl-L-alanine amidase [Spartobacteria bacterium]|nr:N-acetylmuramoyl-L-alanine amidase [Spartobacteria bacterium]